MGQILVVEDSIFQRKKLGILLRAAGHDVIEATNGIECMKILANEMPDCIMLDLVMPEMDGFAVLSALKEQGLAVPVVVLTADIQETTRQRCLDLGARAFVNKPVKAEVLEALALVLNA